MRNIDSIIALHNKSFLRPKFDTIYVIWYPFYNLKNVKNICGRVILSVKFTCNFTKITLSIDVFHDVFLYDNGLRHEKVKGLTSDIKVSVTLNVQNYQYIFGCYDVIIKTQLNQSESISKCTHENNMFVNITQSWRRNNDNTDKDCVLINITFFVR